MWLREAASGDVVNETWEKGVDAGVNIARTTNKLVAWSKKVFGNVAKEIRSCQHHMKELMEMEPTEEVIHQMRCIDARIDELEKRDEVYWHQRSRQNWIECGDKNTTFFHQKANQMAHRNNIRSIKNEAGGCYEEEEEIMECFVNFFEHLFQSNTNCEIEPILNLIQPQISETMAAQLAAPFRQEEVSEALS